MIIQLDEWKDWRISGGGNDWQIQKAVKRRDGATWEGTNFYGSLEYAVEAAYERTLRESPVKGDLKAALAECRRVKSALASEVRKAVEL